MEASPTVTLAEVFGPGVTYVGRASWNGDAFLQQQHPSRRDAATGPLLTFAGSCPTLCSTGALGPPVQALLRAAGLPMSRVAVPYRGPEEFLHALRRQAASGHRLATAYRLPSDEVPDQHLTTPASLLSQLNDKSRLADLVPPDVLPPRRIVTLKEAAETPIPDGGTVVLKGATWLPTGSGGAVVMVRDPRDRERAVHLLQGCDAIVVEEFLPFVRTVCVNFAATHDDRILFLGSADQVSGDDGSFHGNWAGSGFPCPIGAEALGRDILSAAMNRGYRGLAGFDIGVLPDGGLRVFDLNFRHCSSTAGLLWLPWLERRVGHPVTCRLTTLRGNMPFSELCRVAREATEDGWLLPLSAFDPETAGWPDEPPSVRGAVTGRNHAETEARCEALATRGLHM